MTTLLSTAVVSLDLFFVGSTHKCDICSYNKFTKFTFYNIFYTLNVVRIVSKEKNNKNYTSIHLNAYNNLCSSIDLQHLQ